MSSYSRMPQGGRCVADCITAAQLFDDQHAITAYYCLARRRMKERTSFKHLHLCLMTIEKVTKMQVFVFLLIA